jgi:hypothetical protein
MPIINIAVARTRDEAIVEMIAHNGSNLRPITTQPAKYVGTDDKGHGIYETVEQILFLYDSHVGLCLEDREENGHDDSDFYMLVWNPTEQKIDRIMFATTRGWTYPCMGSSADATPEVKAAAAEYLRNRFLESLKAKNHSDARTPAFGKLVKVVKGRKVPVGTQGEVSWTGFDKYAFGGKPKLRIGIRLLDGTTVFTAASNVEVINPATYEKPEADLETTAASYQPGSFVTSVRAGYSFVA